MFLMLNTENYDELVQKYKDQPEKYWEDKLEELKTTRFSIDELTAMLKRIEKIRANKLTGSHEIIQMNFFYAKITNLINYYNTEFVEGQ